MKSKILIFLSIFIVMLSASAISAADTNNMNANDVTDNNDISLAVENIQIDSANAQPTTDESPESQSTNTTNKSNGGAINRDQLFIPEKNEFKNNHPEKNEFINNHAFDKKDLAVYEDDKPGYTHP